MIGNDVVNLTLAKTESNWQRKGFLDKVFTKGEQNIIFGSENQDITVWTLWSRKEAVYKILRQKGESRGFYPLLINCSHENGLVHYKDSVFYSTTQIRNNCIHTIAVTRVTDFEYVTDLNQHKVSIYENEIPFYLENGNCFFMSKSHHGRFERCIYLRKEITK